MRGAGPQSAQIANVSTEIPTTIGTKYPATTSASFWIGARLRWASPTIRTICASNVSAPTRSARITREPVPFTVAPVTRAPLNFSTGIGSPLIIDSSTLLAPSRTTPSTGIFSPGRTRSQSPGFTTSRGTSVSDPSSRIRRAVFGERPSNALIAAPVRLLARNSITCPSSTRAVMAAAASKYTATSPSPPRNDAGNTPGKSTPTTLNAYATPVPKAISVNIFRLRVTSDRPPRTKNGQPPHKTTGVARINSIHCHALGEANCISAESPGNMSAMVTTRIGIVSATETQNLRVISTSSGFFSSSTLIVLGSSAIPQIGQDPGASRTISGCIGQVYSAFVVGSAATTGSSAIPHFGQAPGSCWRTCGSIGHVYSFEAALRATAGAGAIFTTGCKAPCAAPVVVCAGCPDTGAIPT